MSCGIYCTPVYICLHVCGDRWCAMVEVNFILASITTHETERWNLCCLLYSLTCDRCESNITNVFFQTHFMTKCFEHILGNWDPQNPIDGKSTLVQVMACCHQATNHYLSHCWPRNLLPYDVTTMSQINLTPYDTWYYKYLRVIVLFSYVDIICLKKMSESLPLPWLIVWKISPISISLFLLIFISHLIFYWC